MLYILLFLSSLPSSCSCPGYCVVMYTQSFTIVLYCNLYVIAAATYYCFICKNIEYL